MLNFKALETPSLDIDARIAALRGQPLKLSMRETLERRIVFALCAHLQHEGFRLIAVCDGEKREPATTAKDAMELIFDLDEVLLQVQKPGADEHVVLLIPGNGEDIVSSWSFTDGDPDGFDAAMDAFFDRLAELF